ncbi:MAG: hypothetical protein CM1200mP37_1540 [Chloroflexota bacterium]|nr:MAG: hypothetical protein CM1200mP37_1540 [Chloroflexota bacterium]
MVLVAEILNIIGTRFFVSSIAISRDFNLSESSIAENSPEVPAIQRP